MILVFDLDDTLYSEVDFVKSGFKEVTNFLYKEYTLNRNESYATMIQELNQNGRGKIFDVLLQKHNLYSKKMIKKCLSVYRLHKPNISLNKDSILCLKRFENSIKYIVSDGNKIVQKNKIEALNLQQHVKRVFLTHEFGIKNSKPSPYCFMKISNIEKEKPKNIVYIGDNPHKDFVEIKKIGFKTIRINKGMFKNQQFDIEHESHIIIDSLGELSIKLLNKLLYI